MKLSPYIFCPTISRRRRLEGVALVITLLMLSVITFLAIAFLAMSRRNQSAVVTSLDNTTAQAMAQAATARAQAEIMAQILASGDALNYDYMVSRNWINPNGFSAGERTNDPYNINYDFFTSGQPFNPQQSSEQAAWVQNIANLYYDPRPPVFVVTNQLFPNNYDFRFWVDINRNGKFETNGYQPIFTNEPPFGQTPPGPYPFAVLNGEPEFVGVLRNPLQHHSSSNSFLGRYAYLVLPIGKTLDLNYIHNFLKASYTSANGKLNGQFLTNTCFPGKFENDGFARDQGIGSWEINLGALLDNLSPWAYESNNIGYPGYIGGWRTYDYVVPNPASYNQLWNLGSAFDDAEAILHYRYMAPPAYNVYSLVQNFPFNSDRIFETNYMDIFCAVAPTLAPFDYNFDNPPTTAGLYKSAAALPWAGSYPTNMFFDPQDLFDPNKTSACFTNRMILASQRTNTYDRYTFERLLSSIGMGSSPEYGVWVYGDNDINNRPTQLRTKININFDNTAQITNINGPYMPMPTNMVFWQPGTFFNNAAELLLRSQPHYYPVYVTNAFGVVVQSNIVVQANFGVTNIPIYRANNPGIRYDAAVHRLLQLAANIYDAANPSNVYTSKGGNFPPIRHPTIFRPIFQITNQGLVNVGVNIAGYVPVVNSLDAYTNMLLPYQDLTNLNTFHTNWNVAGIPWIVGANKGLPAFYRYTGASQVLLERKLAFPRKIVGGVVQTNQPPASTNQFYLLSVTNCLGIDAWNPYPTNFYGSGNNSLYCFYSNYVTVQITNGYNFGTFTNIGSGNFPNGTNIAGWAGSGAIRVGSRAGFLPIFNNTNVISMPESYYSESLHGFVFVNNPYILSNSFLKADMGIPSGWPVYNWTVNVTNHVVYALFDGVPGQPGTAMLDFVNLGPFGTSISITNTLNTLYSQGQLGTTKSANPATYWEPGTATSLPNSPMSLGLLNQINEAIALDPTWAKNLVGQGTDANPILGCAYNPTWVIQQPTNWVVNDPLVHYTLDDLTWTGDSLSLQDFDASYSDAGDGGPLTPPTVFITPLSNSIGTVSARYSPWGSSDKFGSRMLLKDPGIRASENWQFPTNKFPSVGWLGRVHRGTPWQTVFLKADSSQSYALWSNWANPSWVNTTVAPETYPTNDYPLVDVFYSAPNDNAAHGLLSVNQTNDPAWAAVFAGVIALTNANGGIPIGPINDYYGSIQYLMDSTNGINAQRTNQPNGIFHKVGYILSAPALTISSPYLPTTGPDVADLTDEEVERIPQQTLSLLKVGEPQFAIYAWGQALRPKGPPYLGIGPNANMYTNYEITGEFLTRTICHLVHTNGLKMVIDNYNVESGNN